MSIEVRDMIVSHPWRAIAVGLFAGAALALADRMKSPLGRAFVGALGGLTLELARELAAKQARTWLDFDDRPYATA